MPKRLKILDVMLLLLAFWVPLPTMAGQVSVLTQHNDNSRTGANLNETSLTTSNVNVTQFGKLFSRAVDGQIYAQPLVVSNVDLAGQGIRNVVYVATMKNNVYAFDADDPNSLTPLWRVNLGPSVPWQDTGCCCSDIDPVIGITGTPVIDPSSNTIYLVAKTKVNSSYFQSLHALDITTGQARQSPVVIQATINGTGHGSSGGLLSFNPLKQLNRAGLLLLNGVVYIAFGSHCDAFPYHGWVFGYNPTTLTQMSVFNTTPNGGMSGIWQSGQGLVADANGDVYFMTGNGSFDANTGGTSYGESFVKLTTPGLTVADYFTPNNFRNLNGGDMDLGSAGPLLLPGTTQLAGGGKEGIFYLLDTNLMGHFNAANDQVLQRFQATSGAIHGSPIYWNSPNNGPLIYLWGDNDRLMAFQFANGTLQTTPVATGSIQLSGSVGPHSVVGAMLSLSANGSTPGSGIVWATHSDGGDANHAVVSGVLRAFDASNVVTELWNSKQNSARDDFGTFAKFCPPAIVNGKVYLATFSNQLVVYGVDPKASSDVTLFIPAVLSSAGLNKSFFTSEMTISNRGTQDATINSTYTSVLGSGSGVGSDTLAAGEQRVVPNALQYLRSLGIPIPTSGNQQGTLRVNFSGLASSLDGAVIVRTTTNVPGGRAGLAYAGIPASTALTGPAYLTGLRQNQTDRSNVAIQNVGAPSDGNITLRLTVFSGDESIPFSQALPDQVLPPAGSVQISGVLASNGLSLTNGYVRVEQINGTAPYYAYGVINDQLNSDGSFAPPILESSLVGRTKLTLPVVVEANAFNTELIVTNWSSTQKILNCTYVADAIQAPNATATFTLDVNPSQQLILPDFVQRLRDSAISGVGPKGPAFAGALFVEVSGGDLSGISVSARTSSPGGAGRYGLFYTAVPNGSASTTSAWLYGLQQNVENRTNLALVNTGEADASPDVFRIEIFDGDTGQLANTLGGITLNARRWKQIDCILEQYAPGKTQGYARITRTSGSNPFIAYGVINDGAKPGERSGDGAFMSSSP